MTDCQNKKLWTMEEDETLKKAVSIVNSDKWNDIARKFQQLYFQSYGIVMKRAGKQCRQRWYNKLHPDLTKTLQPWSNEESVALLGIYQQMGPKWAKIIFKLCEAGYNRRSDNNIKNHFHMIVKKSLKDLNQFIQQYNMKMKQSISSNKVKKVYVYEKTYSIEKMIRKQLPKNKLISVNVNDGVSQNFQQKQNGVDDGQNVQATIRKEVKANNNEQNTGSVEELKISQSLKSDQPENKLPSNPIESKPAILRIVDKKSIDRFWLWSNDKSTGRLQILSSVEDTQLRTVRDSFLQYMKHPQLFTSQQLKQLIQEINNYTKCCKKLNKKKRQKIIKQRQDKTKYHIDKTAKRIFDNIIIQNPQQKKQFVKNKQQILSRLVFLVTRIYAKYQRFQEQINKDQLISKKHQLKIKKTIIEEMASLYERQQHQQQIKRDYMQEERQKVVGVDGNEGNGLVMVEDLSMIDKKINKDNQHIVIEVDKNNTPIIQSNKLKKIRKYKKRQPKQKQPTIIVIKRQQSSSNTMKKKKKQVIFVDHDQGLVQEVKTLVGVENNSNNVGLPLSMSLSDKNILIDCQPQKHPISLERSFTEEFFNINNYNNNNNLMIPSQKTIILKKQQPYQHNFFTFIQHIQQQKQMHQQQQQANNPLQISQTFNNNNNPIYLPKQQYPQENNNNMSINPFNNNQQVKIQDSFWNNIKMGQQSEKTTQVNNNNNNHQNNISHNNSNNVYNNCYNMSNNNNYNNNVNNRDYYFNNNNNINNNNNSKTTRSPPSPPLSSQGLYKLQFNRPFQQKHNQSQDQSQYSVKSRKSIRPNRIIYHQDRKFDQFPIQTKVKNVSIQNNIQNNNNNKGSFSEIQKRFPDALVKSIQLGQSIQMNNFTIGQYSPFEGEMLRGSHHNLQQQHLNNRSGFMYFNNNQQHQVINPFQSFTPSTPDPLRILTNSQQFLINNNSNNISNNSLFHNNNNKLNSSTNYQHHLQHHLQQGHNSMFNSNDFLAMSCQNVFQQQQQQQQRFNMSNSGRVVGGCYRQQIEKQQLSGSNSNGIHLQQQQQQGGFNIINNNNTNNNNNNRESNNNNNNNKDSGFFTSSFFQNIKSVQQQQLPTPLSSSNINNNNPILWKQPQIFNFEHQNEHNPFPFSNKPIKQINSSFNPFISQPIDFQIPQKLIQTVRNPHFPIKNYNDYSLNYQHANSLQYSKMFEFDKKFGFNSARLSQIDLFRSQQRSYSHRSRSKQLQVGSNMFKSQKIHSLHDSCQFVNKSRQLSNSCIYSNHQERSLFGSGNGSCGKNINNIDNSNFNNNNINNNNRVINNTTNSNIFIRGNPRFINFPPEQIFDDFNNTNSNNNNNK